MQLLGQAEVGNARSARAVQQDIGGLQVAVNDPLLVGVPDRQADGVQQFHRLPLRQVARRSRSARLGPSTSFIEKKCSPSCCPTS